MSLKAIIIIMHFLLIKLRSSQMFKSIFFLRHLFIENKKKWKLGAVSLHSPPYCELRAALWVLLISEPSVVSSCSGLHTTVGKHE